MSTMDQAIYFFDLETIDYYDTMVVLSRLLVLRLSTDM